MNLYKEIWARIGGRPFTFIYRDFYRKYEYFIQLQWFATGVFLIWFVGFSIPITFLIFCWLIYTFGYINGHFFWGSKIIEGQKGDTNGNT